MTSGRYDIARMGDSREKSRRSIKTSATALSQRGERAASNGTALPIVVQAGGGFGGQVPEIARKRCIPAGGIERDREGPGPVHVPELNDLVIALGLAPYFEHVFCSAEMGVEKPHPAFLATVLESLGRPEIAWVIGDSVSADIASARAAGVGSILVGSHHPSADYCIQSLRQVPGLLSKTAVACAQECNTVL